MADWTDGAEYAPLERPEAFAAPRASTLTVEETPPSPAAGQPSEAPGDYHAPRAQPLDELVPRVASPRDPQVPFESASSTSGPLGASHPDEGWDPRQPFVVDSGEGPQDEWGAEPGLPSFPPPTGAPIAVSPGPNSLGGPAPGPQPADQALTAGPTMETLRQLPPPTGQPVPLPPPSHSSAGQPSPGAQPFPSQAASAQPPVAPPPMAPSPAAPPRPANPFDPANFAPRPPGQAGPGSQPAADPQQRAPQQWPAPQQQSPAQQQWPPPPQGQAPQQVQLPQDGPVPMTAGSLLRIANPLSLAFLVFGVILPQLSYIMLIAASWTSRRSNPRSIQLAALYNLALTVMLGTLLYDTLVERSMMWPHLAPVGLWLSVLMIPATLWFAYDEMRRRNRR